MKLWRGLVLAALVGGSGLACGMLTACSRPEQAPDVHWTLLDGRQAGLAALRGRVVLVNFWASDCVPCVAEMPALAGVWRELSSAGFDAVAISMAYDPPFAVQNFARAHRLPFAVALDSTGELAARFGGIDATPTSLLIDKQGRIVARWIGPADIPALRKRVGELLAER